MTDTPEPEKVGYGRPPKQYQFKKGKSGNPGGRPKGSKSSDDIVIQNLERRVPVRIDGQLVKTTIHNGIFMAQAKKALEGDTKAAKFLIDSHHRAEERKYYLETAVRYLEKQITRGLQKQPSDPKEAERILNDAQAFAEEIIRKYGSKFCT